jgi:hypothetical protein
MSTLMGKGAGVPGVKTSSIRMISPVSVSPNSNFVSAMIIPFDSAYDAAYINSAQGREGPWYIVQSPTVQF